MHLVTAEYIDEDGIPQSMVLCVTANPQLAFEIAMSADALCPQIRQGELVTVARYDLDRVYAHDEEPEIVLQMRPVLGTPSAQSIEWEMLKGVDPRPLRALRKDA